MLKLFKILQNIELVDDIIEYLNLNETITRMYN